MQKRELIAKVIAKLGKHRYDFEEEMSITIYPNITAEINEKKEILSYKVLLGKIDITSEIKKDQGDAVLDVIKDNIDVPNSLLFIKDEKQEVTLEKQEFDIDVEVSANINPGSKGSREEPPEHEHTEDLTVMYGKIDITKGIDEDDIEKKVFKNYDPPESLYDTTEERDGLR